jgi:hypothetical protein
VHGLPFAARLFASALAARVRPRRRSIPQRPAPEALPSASAADRVVFGYGSLERLRADLLAELMEPELELDAGPEFARR